jgi:hypothetical protein
MMESVFSMDTGMAIAAGVNTTIIGTVTANAIGGIATTTRVSRLRIANPCSQKFTEP